LSDKGRNVLVLEAYESRGVVGFRSGGSGSGVRVGHR
jgi:hypothetical protein